jgi:trimethylamine:corrinoid methyltransferase-like protein
MNMQPNITLLSDELVKQILDEAFQLLIMPGIKVQSPAAMQLLEDAGAQVDLSLRSLRQTES